MESLLKGFLKETERSSDRIALIILKNEGECVVTYKELSNMASKVAAFLLKHGVKQGDRVAISLGRGEKLIAAILGVLWIGAVYVPVNLKQPLNRRRVIYEQADIKHCRLKDLFITPSACMCTIFMKVLSVYSDEKEFTVTLTLFNRAPVHKDINLVLGDFTNIGFASYYVAKDVTFLEELRETSKQFWKLVEFHSYDGTRVLKEMSRSIPGKAVMPIVFTSVLQGKLKSREELSYHDSFTISQTPQTAIDHQLRDDGEGMRLSWDYIEELFDEIDIQKMFDTYIGFTRRIIEADDWKCRLEVEKI